MILPDRFHGGLQFFSCGDQEINSTDEELSKEGRMKLHFWWVVVSCALLACAPAFSQSTLGLSLGTVQDASGGSIAGGEIETRNLDENTTRRTASNEVGLLQFATGPPDDTLCL